MWRIAWFVGIAGIIVGCTQGQLGPLAAIKPTVRLHHLSLRNVGLTGGTLDVVLALYNPNRFTIRGTRLNVGIDVEGRHFGDAELAGPIPMVERDTSLITAPLTFEWQGVGAAARSIVNSGAVNYEMNGTISVDTPIGQPLAVQFSGQGSVPLLHGGNTR
jgi:hypothetical protein